MKYRVSISKLVDFACRSGDLVLQSTQGPTAQQGIKAHQKVQQQQSPQVQSEVAFKVALNQGDDELVLSGRIDLLDSQAMPPMIQEIKSTLVPVSKIPQGVSALHWAQLKLYGYCYLLQQKQQQDLDVSLPLTSNVELCLLWFNLQDESLDKESSVFTYADLQAYAEAAVARYLSWIKKVEAGLAQTLESSQALSFPYQQFRAGQRDMAAATFRVARDTGYLLCEAPTGIGKTISTLFPAVKAIGEGHIKKVAYLTAKTSGREVALNTVRDLQQSGLQISYLVIHSKALICPCSNGSCERDELGRCPYTLGFFDRLPQARDTLLDNGAIDTQLLSDVADKYRLCPFELSLQMLPWVTLVICDYNYVFDPLVRLSAFTEPDKKLMLLLDETHNLVDRARNMYSARLTRQQNQALVKACKNKHPELVSALKGLTRALDRWAKAQQPGEWFEAEAPATVSRAVTRCLEAMSSDSLSNTVLPEGAFEWFKELFRYAVIEELFGAQHRTLGVLVKEGRHREIELRLFCVNASEYLTRSFSLFRAVVAFSATLRPLEYYRQSQGMPDNTQGMLLESPFDPARLGVYICPYVDTRYRQRQASLSALVELIYNVYNARQGNYLVFFPSYAYLHSVLQAFSQSYPEIEVVAQQRSAEPADREWFLQQFGQCTTVLGFAIMGGVFGEGVDYEGERLIGSILVGTGLPAFGLEQQLIADDYNKSGLDGFDYAYRYPGFTRVLQTAGRVIRSEHDRGVVVLVDSRFTQSFYRSLYPAHWAVEVCSTHQNLAQGLGRFWA